MNLEDKPRSGSKLLNQHQGPRPSFERTEGEKITLAKTFLEKRGLAVMDKMISVAQIAGIAGCTTAHILNLSHNDPTFPKGHDIACRMRDHEPNRKYLRYSSMEVKAWIESRKEFKRDDN